MAVYNPLFVYLTPASIPQVVAHIQKYLADNPIVSDPEAIAGVIQKYIEEHPEIIAVASVNGKTGNVVLTGSDININASSAVSVETQLLNLASMISTAGADIAQINAQLETIYTNIGTIETNVYNNTSAISALQTSVEGHGTRLTTAEGDIEALESAQSAQNTRLNSAEGNISSIQTHLDAAETDIDNLETAQTAQGTRINSAEGNISSIQTKVERIENEMTKILHFDAEITVVPNTNFSTVNFESFGVERNQIISLVLLYTEAVYYDIPQISLGTSENLIYVKLSNNVTVNRVYKVRAFYLE